MSLRAVVARTATDALTVAVSRAGPEAAPAIAEMLGRCSAETIFRRVRGFSARAVDQLVLPVRTGRPRGRLDLVAQAGPLVAGWGCLVPDAGAWEVALVVDDAWQARGVGDRLAAALLSWAATAELGPVRAVTTHGDGRVAALIRRRAEIVRPPVLVADEVEYWLIAKDGGRARE